MGGFKTSIDLFKNEIKHSANLKNILLKNIKTKKEKIVTLNVTNIVFNFKKEVVEIQDEIGITEDRIQKISINDFLNIIDKL